MGDFHLSADALICGLMLKFCDLSFEASRFDLVVWLVRAAGDWKIFFSVEVSSFLGIESFQEGVTLLFAEPC